MLQAHHIGRCLLSWPINKTAKVSSTLLNENTCDALLHLQWTEIERERERQTETKTETGRETETGTEIERETEKEEQKGRQRQEQEGRQRDNGPPPSSTITLDAVFVDVSTAAVRANPSAKAWINEREDEMGAHRITFMTWRGMAWDDIAWRNTIRYDWIWHGVA